MGVPADDVLSADGEYESVTWCAVSIDPADYNIKYSDEIPDFSRFTLAKLCAYCLYSDGAYSESSFDELYQRFMEAPSVVLGYFALIGDQVARGGSTGDEPAASELCRYIADANVFWYDCDEQFTQIVEDFQARHKEGRIAGLLAILVEEQQAAALSWTVCNDRWSSSVRIEQI